MTGTSAAVTQDMWTYVMVAAGQDQQIPVWANSVATLDGVTAEKTVYPPPLDLSPDWRPRRPSSSTSTTSSTVLPRFDVPILGTTTSIPVTSVPRPGSLLYVGLRTPDLSPQLGAMTEASHGLNDFVSGVALAFETHNTAALTTLADHPEAAPGLLPGLQADRAEMDRRAAMPPPPVRSGSGGGTDRTHDERLLATTAAAATLAAPVPPAPAPQPPVAPAPPAAPAPPPTFRRRPEETEPPPVLTHADLRAAIGHPDRFPPDVVAAATFVDHERSLQSLLDPGAPVRREDAALFLGLAVNLGVLRRHFGAPLPPAPTEPQPPLAPADLQALAAGPAGPEAETARWLLAHEPQRRRLAELDATVAGALGLEPAPAGAISHESLLALAADRQAHGTCEPAHMT